MTIYHPTKQERRARKVSARTNPKHVFLPAKRSKFTNTLRNGGANVPYFHRKKPVTLPPLNLPPMPENEE